MALPYISVEDCFPVIRQTILDAYKVDSFLMHYPYSDLERLDMGFAKWSGEPTPQTPPFSLCHQSRMHGRSLY